MKFVELGRLKFLLLSLLVTLGGVSPSAFADDEDDDQQVGIGNLANIYDFQKLGGMTGRLQPHGNNLMGDMIDKNTGGITFEHTDISLPGNSSLEVALRRKNTQGAKRFSPYQQAFGDWVLDLPIAHAAYMPNDGAPGALEPQFNGGCLVDPGPLQRDARMDASQQTLDVRVDVHVDGVYLKVPGKGLTGFSGNIQRPSDPAANWVSGAQSTDHAGRCATVVIAPDGTKYKFGRHAFRQAKDLTLPYKYTGASQPDTGTNLISATTSAPRKHIVYLVTEVVDVNGNWVRYEYESSGRAELTRIHSNDGRSININYEAGVPDATFRNSRRISTVTTNGRTWRYNYVKPASSSDVAKALYKVTLPDGRFWRLGESQRGMFQMAMEVQENYECVPLEDSFSMTHPDGAIGTFVIRETRHIKGASNLGSLDDDFDHYMQPMTIPHFTNNNECNVSTATRPRHYRPLGWPIFRAMSVKSKRITGAGLPTATWGYQYRNYDSGALDYNWTKISNPSGSVEYYEHYAVSSQHGLLRRQVTTPPAGQQEVISYEYNVTAPTHPDCTAGGDYGDSSGMCHTYKHRPVTKVFHSKDGDLFTTINSYSQNGAGNFTDYGYPNTVRRYASFSGSTTARVTSNTYEHKLGLNVIGLPKRVVQNSRELERYDYDSLGRVTTEYRYNQLFARYTYHTHSEYRGALATTTDAVGRQIFRTDYKLGTPERIRRPDNVWTEVEIDDNGWMTSSTDAMSNTTSYGRDIMGRLTLIDPPGPWNNTSVSYNFSGGGAVQTITRGQSRETVTYDKMLRPVLEESEALDTNWASYVNMSYHPQGQLKFRSQPSSYVSETKGVNFTYDGFGRLTQKKENVAPYATESYRYLSSNRYEVTDAAGHKTTQYKDGYAGAGGGDLVRISQPLGVETVLHRNIWGQLVRLQQSGNQNGYATNQSQYYYYDSRQRLCRSRTPEGGDTLSQYDNSGYLIAYAKGMAYGTNCAAPSGASKVTIARDDLARVIKTDYTDPNTPDIVYTYDDNGNVLTNNRDGVNWTYTYDEVNHLTSELLEVDGKSFGLSYVYDANENIIQRSFPSGRVVDYTHDGLGRERSARSNGAYYANNVAFHANGLISSMTYGNGQAFTQTLNNRLFPERLRAVKGGITALDLDYDYDVRGSVISMYDRTDANNYRAYGYDALNRIDVANGPWGAGSFTYDALGNLRSKTLGSRQVNVNYDSNNRATRSTDTAGSTRNLSYDSRGNVTTLGGLSFEYDYSDQPTKLMGSSSGDYTYDGNLKRVKAKVNGQTVYNVYDAAGKLVHVDKRKTVLIPYKSYMIPIAAPNETDYIHVAGMTVARITKDQPTYLHPDHLGSPVAGSEASGAVAWKEQYTPFGEKRIGDSANDDLGGYTGHISDSATGLTYMQARYYDPVIGRFLSVDPVNALDHLNGSQGVQGFNRYAYVNNNPTNANDPNGEIANFLVGAVIGIVSEVAVQVVFEGKSFSEIDGLAVAQAGITGAFSGGVGGSAGKLAGRVLNAATRPNKSSFAKGASKVITEAGAGAVGGAAAGAVGGALNQAATGDISPQKIAQAAKTGALNGAATGAIAGGVTGSVLASNAKAATGSSRANTAFLKSQPGERSAAVAGGLTSTVTSVGTSANERCGQSEGC